MWSGEDHEFIFEHVEFVVTAENLCENIKKKLYYTYTYIYIYTQNV
jgi:hypothetical protein